MEMGPGIPRKCQCGAPTIILISSTKQNPGRKFYRCGVIPGSNHVFKWVDEAHLEEFDVLANRQTLLAKGMSEIKKELVELKKDICDMVTLIESFRSKI